MLSFENFGSSQGTLVVSNSDLNKCSKSETHKRVANTQCSGPNVCSFAGDLDERGHQTRT